MREIKFRGKAFFDGAWVYGHYFRDGAHNEIARIRQSDGKVSSVTPSTVGQYTGVKDVNGTEIYEGDILQSKRDNVKGVHLVIWYKNGFQIEFRFRRSYRGEEYEDKNHLPICPDRYEVIGNKFDNPKLLEVRV